MNNTKLYIILSHLNVYELNKFKKFILKKINSNRFNFSNLIVVIGGDGFMLNTIKKNILTTVSCLNKIKSDQNRNHGVY